MNSKTNSTILQRIQSKYKCREVQIQQVFHYLNLPNDQTHNVVVYGPRATGKSTILREIMDSFKVGHVWIDAQRFMSTKQVYESILKQTADWIAGNYLDEQSYINRDFRCQNSVVFFEKLSHLLKNFFQYIDDHSAQFDQPHERKFCLVFDNFENLIKNDNQDLAYILKNLSSLMDVNVPITVFYISHHSSEWLGRNFDFELSCFQVVFNSYTNEELIEILTTGEFPEDKLEFGTQFYVHYIQLLLKSLLPFSRNLLELRDICDRNFSVYIAPIKRDEITVKESTRLYLHFQPRILELIDFISDHKMVRLPATAELSKSMSYLLIACYLASHNSSKDDKRYFVKNQGRVKSRKKAGGAARRPDVEASEPKAFTFERMFNIYQALLLLNELDESNRKLLTIDWNVHSQFQELIRQCLIAPSGKKFSVDSLAKYQLSHNVTIQYVKTISGNIGLELKAFTEAV